MGVVWLGVHRRHNIPVAVKVIASQRARTPSFQASFLREVVPERPSLEDYFLRVTEGREADLGR